MSRTNCCVEFSFSEPCGKDATTHSSAAASCSGFPEAGKHARLRLSEKFPVVFNDDEEDFVPLFADQCIAAMLDIVDGCPSAGDEPSD